MCIYIKLVSALCISYKVRKISSARLDSFDKQLEMIYETSEMVSIVPSLPVERLEQQYTNISFHSIRTNMYTNYICWKLVTYTSTLYA